MSSLLLWSSQVLPLVRSLGLVHHLSENRLASEEIMDTETKETHDQSIETWSHNDGLLTSWLLGFMTEEVMLLLDGTKTTYDVWNFLEEKLLPMTKEKENRFDYSYQSEEIPQALAAMALNEEDKDPNFYVDSGAITHIANDPEFSLTVFFIMDQLQQVLARGTKKGRLYALEENVIQAMIVTRSSKASSEVWHQHMGHPQTKSIKLLQDKNFIEMPIEMVSFSTSDASCETSKIDHQTKSWKENTANQSSNSKKCNHCPCTTEQRNQFSGEERIYASCNTNQNTEASCVNPIGTPTVVAAKISIIAASTNDQNIVITTETPTNVALGASGHNSNIATTTGTLSQIEFTSSYKHANKNKHVGPSLQNKSTGHSADDEVPNINKQIVVDISSP
ncbi:hypothetical protein CK203_025547 [Vitis vinifera]|uniref:GAG-pre-integrase domain-containing protein n=1 Tax=Vitis vinifera TaxID=29760 RepID=A0A438IED2_VITVI|nr:hypothetical protein CK203_025547 [Vitis vinifera]